MKGRTLVLATTVLVTLLTACDDKPEAAAPARQYDVDRIACPAFSGDPAATLGVSGPASTVENLPYDAIGKSLLCTWDPADYTLMVRVTALVAKDASRRNWEVLTRDLLTPVPLDDLGDKAAFSSPKDPAGTVQLDVLDSNLQVAVSALPQGSARPAHDQLAATVKAIAQETIAAQPRA